MRQTYEGQNMAVVIATALARKAGRYCGRSPGRRDDDKELAKLARMEAHCEQHPRDAMHAAALAKRLGRFHA